MNVTKGKLRKIVNEELKRIHENRELTLSDEEKEELMASLEDAAITLQKKSDEIDIGKIRDKFKNE